MTRENRREVPWAAWSCSRIRLAFPWRVMFSHQKTFLNSVTSLISIN